MKRGGPLRQVSAKRQAENREREKAKREVMTRANGRCEAAQRVGSVATDQRYCAGQFDFHEVLTRARGGSISDPANILYVCRRHHDWITTHPQEAHELGLVAHSWEEAHRNAVVEGIIRDLGGPAEAKRLLDAGGDWTRPVSSRTPSTALRAANVVPRAKPTPQHVKVLSGPEKRESAGKGTISVTFVHTERPWTLNGERKMTPYGRADKVRQWKEAWTVIGHQAQRFKWVDIDVKVHLRNQIEQDTVGAVPAYKAALDGLVRAKVLPDDDGRYVRSVKFHPPENGTYDALELILTGEPA